MASRINTKSCVRFDHLTRNYIRGFVMISFSRLAAALAFVPVMLFGQTAYANSIVNGDFQSGSLAGWTTYTTSGGGLTGSTSLDPLTFVSFDVDGNGSSSLAPRFRVGEVGSYTGLWSGGGIYQSFATGAGSLFLSLDVAAYLDPATSTTSNGAGGLFQVYLDGVLATSFDAGSIANGQIKRQELSFSEVVAAGTHELRIQMTRNYFSGWLNNTTTGSSITPVQFVDDIVVNAPTAVPEPAITLMMFSGLALLGLVVKRRA